MPDPMALAHLRGSILLPLLVRHDMLAWSDRWMVEFFGCKL
jgi:hypothetical protein